MQAMEKTLIGMKRTWPVGKTWSLIKDHSIFQGLDESRKVSEYLRSKEGPFVNDGKSGCTGYYRLKEDARPVMLVRWECPEEFRYLLTAPADSTVPVIPAVPTFPAVQFEEHEIHGSGSSPSSFDFDEQLDEMIAGGSGLTSNQAEEPNPSDSD
jgi:hypothetical protein